MRNYIGLIHKETDSDFGVSFPDLPGLATAGTSLDDARAMAEEALALHIEGLVADGEAIPEPSSLEEVMTDPDNRDSVAILVAVKTAARKAVRVNVTLPEDVLEQIDSFAAAHGFTRSQFIAQAGKESNGTSGSRLTAQRVLAAFNLANEHEITANKPRHGRQELRSEI